MRFVRFSVNKDGSAEGADAAAPPPAVVAAETALELDGVRGDTSPADLLERAAPLLRLAGALPPLPAGDEQQQAEQQQQPEKEAAAAAADIDDEEDPLARDFAAAAGKRKRGGDDGDESDDGYASNDAEVFNNCIVWPTVVEGTAPGLEEAQKPGKRQRAEGAGGGEGGEGGPTETDGGADGDNFFC